VAAAGGSNSSAAAQALEWLCGVYWYPLYAFCRRKGHGAEDAFDLTQEFFTRLLEKCSIAGADPAKGKFRTYLLTSFERFLVNEWKREHRLKRGGGRMPFSFNAAAAEERYRLEPADVHTAERIYERRWALTLLEQTLERLGAECAASGRLPLFEAVKPELSGEGGESTLAEIAGRLGMTTSAVKTAMHRLRRRYGELLRAEIAQTVALPDEIDDEIRQLFSILE
jgi:RNA polymerase sigma-70 factor (ECF subfamily)